MRPPTLTGRMLHRRRRREGGTITIEAALIFPALFAVMFTIIDGGRLMGSRVMLSQATIAAARTDCLSSSTSPANADQATRDAVPMLTGISVQSIGCASPASPLPGSCAYPRQKGDLVTVTVTYTFNPGFLQVLAKTLTQTSRAVCE